MFDLKSAVHEPQRTQGSQRRELARNSFDLQAVRIRTLKRLLLFVFSAFFAVQPPCLASVTLRSRIPGIAQTVAEEIQGQQRQGQDDAGMNNHPPINADRIDLRRTFGDE